MTDDDSARPLERVSKLDAARRQIATAIRLLLEEKDTVSTYTLAAAAQGILHDLLTHRGSGGFIRGGAWVRPEKRKEYFRMITRAENFFKHADRDADQDLAFNPDTIPFALLDCVDMHQRYTGKNRPEGVVFLLWFEARSPGILEQGVVRTVVERIKDRYPLPPVRSALFLEMLDQAATWPGFAEEIP